MWEQLILKIEWCTDWEAIADSAPDQLLPSVISKVSLDDSKVQKPKRRGRGTFSYKKNEFYSDRLSDNDVVEDEKEGVCLNSEIPTQSKNSKTLVFNIFVS